MRIPVKAGLAAGAAALLSLRRTGRVPRPSPGRVADPSALPRPKLFGEPMPGQQPRAFEGLEEERSTASPGSRPAYVAVGVMVVGVMLVGLCAVLLSWPLLVAGVLVGSVGIVLARRARIMQDVSVTDSPHRGP